MLDVACGILEAFGGFLLNMGRWKHLPREDVEGDGMWSVER